MKFDFDFLVIGAGSGGVRASRIAAKHGARVAVIEKSDLGGTCVNLGCVPKKLFAYASQYHETSAQAQGFGWQFDNPRFDWTVLRNNKDKEIKRLNQIYEKLLIDAQVKIIHGAAEFLDPHTVRVENENYRAKYILIATGSHSFVPDLPGKDLAITSDLAFHLDALPHRAIIIGGGYIAVEFATIFNGLGVDTTLVYRDKLLLRGFDLTVREFIGQELQKKGIKLLSHHVPLAIDKTETELQVKFENETQATDLVFMATGRRANTVGLNLEAMVKKRDDGSIIVNDRYQTSADHIYAIGDVTGGPELTPLAIAQGHIVADNLFAGMNRRLQSTLIPTAVFCEPNIGTVGLSEADARKQYGEVNVYQTTFRALKHTLSGSDEKTLMKLITDKKTDKILGLHMVGSDAGEIIQSLAVALQMGATKADFDHTLAVHPTLAEEFVTLR